jgi:uncharacterized protein
MLTKIIFEIKLGNYLKAKELLENNLNEEWANHLLGKLYYEGLGVNYDFKKSFEYFKKSNENNEYHSLGMLGGMYLNGIGTKRDKEKGIEILSKGIEMKETDSYYHFGKHLLKIKDYENGLKVLEEGSELGNEECMNYLFFVYLNGKTKRNEKIVEVDTKRALGYLEKGIALENSNSYANMGKILRIGNENIQQDREKSNEYFEVALSRKNSKAFIYLSEIFRLENNFDKSIKILNKGNFLFNYYKKKVKN